MTHIQERIQICIAKIIQNNPQVKNIFEEIYQQGGRVLLVGGAVRDCLMGCLSSDLDFEVYHLSFEELDAILQKFGKVCFIGKSFGVLRIMGFDADWSIPRTDSYGRKPTVELNPNMSFEQAFRRRDVTVNAMGIDVYSHELIDPFGGVHDLKNKILRSPDVTFFVQDPLRLFRIVQFIGRFGMQVDSTLSQVCSTMDIAGVSVERIEAEFYKLFTKSHKPSLGIAWLVEIGRISEILPQVKINQELYDALDGLAQYDNVSTEQRLLGSWAYLVSSIDDTLLLHVDVSRKISLEQHKCIQSWLKLYIGSHDLIHRTVLLGWYLKYIPTLVQQGKDVDYKRLAHWLAPDCNLQQLSDLGICWWPEEMIESFIQQAKVAKVLYHQEEPLLTGKDLLSYAQGKDLGDMIERAYVIQLTHGISDKQKLLHMLLKQDV